MQFFVRVLVLAISSQWRRVPNHGWKSTRTVPDSRDSQHLCTVSKRAADLINNHHSWARGKSAYPNRPWEREPIKPPPLSKVGCYVDCETACYRSRSDPHIPRTRRTRKATTFENSVLRFLSLFRVTSVHDCIAVSLYPFPGLVPGRRDTCSCGCPSH